VANPLNRIRRTAPFSALTILVLALGVAGVAVCEALNSALLSPVSGVEDIHTLVNIYQSSSGGLPFRRMSWPDVLDLSAAQHTLASVGASAPCEYPAFVAKQIQGGACEEVAGDYFETLGLRAAEFGRLLTRDDSVGRGRAVAVVSFEAWKQYFGSAASVSESFVRIGGRDFAVVGVAPRRFRGLIDGGVTRTVVWIPSAAVTASFPELLLKRQSRDHRHLMVKGRLRPDVGLAAVRSEVAGIGFRLDREVPIGRHLDGAADYEISRRWTVRPSADVLINEGIEIVLRPASYAARTLFWLLLAVACVNVSSLLAARSIARRDEFRIRIMLGASSWRLVLEGLVENLVVCGAGVAAGLVSCALLLRTIAANLPLDLAALYKLTLGPQSAVLVVMTSGLSFAVACIAPISFAFGAATRALPNCGDHILPTVHRRAGFVAWQAGASIGLLVLAAGVSNAARASARPLDGADIAPVVLSQLDLRHQGIETPRGLEIVSSGLARVGSLPAVDSVSASTGYGLGIYAPLVHVAATGGRMASVRLLGVTPAFFTVLDVRFARGRGLRENDEGRDAVDVVVSQGVADKLARGGDVLGATLRLDRPVVATSAGPELMRIVGVVSLTPKASSGPKAEDGFVYAPFSALFDGEAEFAVRFRSEREASRSAVWSIVNDLDASVRVGAPLAATSALAPAHAFLEAAGATAGGVGLFVGLLTFAGLYGATQFFVQSRSREIGLRVALGARPADLIFLVAKQALSPTAKGCLGAVLVLVFLAKLQRRMMLVLPDVVFVFLVIGAALVVALLAASGAVRKALRLSPADTLRSV